MEDTNQHISFKESGIHQRLVALLKEVDMNLNEFSRTVGFSSGALSKIIGGKKSFGIEKLYQMLSVYPLLNLHWLLSGKGPIFFEDEGFFDLPKQLNEEQLRNRELQAKLEAYKEMIEYFAKAKNEQP